MALRMDTMLSHLTLHPADFLTRHRTYDWKPQQFSPRPWRDQQPRLAADILTTQPSVIIQRCNVF